MSGTARTGGYNVEPLCSACSVCGNTQFNQNTVLWPELIQAWELRPAEVTYIDEQQGYACSECHSNFRAMTLASAIMDHFGFTGTFAEFTLRHNNNLRVLEINGAGQLFQYFAHMPQHVFAEYPQVDMQNMPKFSDNSFDVVVHSDTLEHVRDPLAALRECRRVLKSGGILAYTIPIIVGRLSRRRDELPPSYHGDPKQSGEDFRVVTEYGADFWMQPFEAAFSKVKLFSTRMPQSIAIIAIK